MAQRCPLLATSWNLGINFSYPTCEQLRRQILQPLPANAARHGIRRIRVLFVGPPNSGKSTFINNVDSAMCNEDKGRAETGSGAGRNGQCTLKLTSFTIGALQFELIDTCGWLYDAQGAICGYPADTLTYLLDGNLWPGCDLSQPINTNDPRFNRNPTEADKIHVAVFMVPYALHNSAPVHKIVRDWRTLLANRRARSMALITKLDLHAPAAGHLEAANIHAADCLYKIQDFRNAVTTWDMATDVPAALQRNLTGAMAERALWRQPDSGYHWLTLYNFANIKALALDYIATLPEAPQAPAPDERDVQRLFEMFRPTLSLDDVRIEFRRCGGNVQDTISSCLRRIGVRN